MATVDVKALTAAEVSVEQAKMDALAGSSIKTVSGSNTLSMLLGFDGTKNIKSNPKYSGDPFSTAVGVLSDKVIKNDNVRVAYYKGVGTPGTSWDSAVFPTDESKLMAQRGYDAYAREAYMWRKDHPNGVLTLDVMCFSRGIVPVALLAQMLNEKGLVYVDPLNDNKETRVINPGEATISNALVLSPVATGAVGSLTLPDNVRNKSVVLADDEHRSNYTQDMIPGATKFGESGNHCDVGCCSEGSLGTIHLGI